MAEEWWWSNTMIKIQPIRAKHRESSTHESEEDWPELVHAVLVSPLSRDDWEGAVLACGGKEELDCVVNTAAARYHQTWVYIIQSGA